MSLVVWLLVVLVANACLSGSNVFLLLGIIIVVLQFVIAKAYYERHEVTKETRRFCFADGKKSCSKAGARNSETVSSGPLFPEYEELSEAVETLINNVISNFIKTWYTSISESDQFPDAVKHLLRDAIMRLADISARIDLCDLIIVRILPLLTKHYTTFYTSQEIVTSRFSGAKNVEAIDLAVAVEFNKQYRIHRALTLSSSEQSLLDDLQHYSRKQSANILPKLVHSDELKSPYVRIILREVLACSVLQPIICKMTTPDFWNTKLIDMCSEALKERTQVSEVRAALSRTLEDQFTAIKDEEGFQWRTLDVSTIYGPDGDYETFLKRLSCLTNMNQLNTTKIQLLTEALKLRNAPISQTVPRKIKKNQREIKKIELALNLINSKIAFLYERNGGNKGIGLSLDDQLKSFQKTLDAIDVNEVLKDKSCSEFFDSFLRRMGSEAGLFHLRLWRYVENIRNPLEDISNDEIQLETTSGSNEQLQELASVFMSDSESLSNMRALDENSVNIILHYLNDIANQKVPAEEQLSRAFLSRKSMLFLQQEAFKELSKKWFPNFKESKEFYQMVSFESQVHKFEHENDAVPALSEVSHSDTARIISHGNLNKTLDDIINNEGKDASGSLPENGSQFSTVQKPSASQSFSDIFGKEDQTLFDDELFDNASSLEDDQMSKLDTDLSQPPGIAFDSQDNLAGSGQLERSSMTDSSILKPVNLKEEIGTLALNIDQLKRQLQLLRHLILKAELTNSQSKLRLLKKSERTLIRELEYKELLQQQHMVNENANSLHGRAMVSIKSYLTDMSVDDGKETVYYLITVQHSFDKQVVTWDVPRRFSEFYRLHSFLKGQYPAILKRLQTSAVFPERIKISLKYHVSKTLLYEERRRRLETYMQELLKVREICQDEYFRKFLTDVSNTFTVEKYVDDNEEKRRSVVLRKADSVGEVTNVATLEMGHSNNSTHELDFIEDERNFYTFAESSTAGTLVKPICELFVCFFALNHSNTGWFRGRAIIVVLQKLLGSTIEKYIKDHIQRVRSPEKLSYILSKLNETLWVNGTFFKSGDIEQPPMRTEGEISRAGLESQATLERFMVETCGKVVGTAYASNAALRLHSMLQNEYLNVSLVLEILDVVFEVLNPVQSKSSNP